MTTRAGNQRVKSAIVGNLRVPPFGEVEEGTGDAPDPDERVPMLVAAAAAAHG